MITYADRQRTVSFKTFRGLQKYKFVAGTLCNSASCPIVNLTHSQKSLRDQTQVHNNVLSEQRGSPLKTWSHVRRRPASRRLFLNWKRRIYYIVEAWPTRKC